MNRANLLQKLSLQHQQWAKQTLRHCFASDPERATRYQLSAAGLWVDYSKNHLNDQTLSLLLNLAETCDVTTAINTLFCGGKINNTEQRAVLHTALRQQHDDPVLVDGQDVIPAIRAQQHKMRVLVDAVYQGRWVGYSGKAITDVVNIGIGGSDLGPRMVCKALTPFHTNKVRCHFVANVDGTDLALALKNCNPETTLFIVASKSFGTQETLINAQSARQWLLDAAQDNSATAKHFVAISSAVEKVKAFGIAEDNIFEMWDWVGGRYSLWSTIGLPIAMAIGMDNFMDLLHGAFECDTHFRTANVDQNMPVILALISLWYSSFWGAQSEAVIPYDTLLEYLPNYLQQLVMESNGKSVQRDGEPVTGTTSSVIWGGIGTNGQHAFHQLLHQGTLLCPVDFIMPRQSHYPLGEHHAALYANCLAQSQALMQGKTLEEATQELVDQGLTNKDARALAPHKVIAGNKPSNTVLVDKITPKTLGALIALYEHKTFVQSVIWNINAFDQWGVELGKQLGGPILHNLQTPQADFAVDSSTQQLLAQFQDLG